MIKPPTAIGIIGTGFGAKVHAPGWGHIPNAQLIGIAGRTAEQAGVAAAQHNIRAYDNWQDLIVDPSIDLVDIATPPHLHAEMIRAAAKAGKNILCEKPFCTSRKEAENMLALVEKERLRHGINFEFVFIPHFAYLKTLLIKEHPIGAIRSIDVEWLTGGQAQPKAPLRWVNYTKNSGGVLGNYASHVFHYLEWLFGPIASVSGLLKLTRPFQDADAEDWCSVHALIQSEIPVSVTVSNVVHGGSGHTLTIYGETGTLTLKNPNVFDAVKGFGLFLTRPDKAPEALPIPKSFGKVDQTISDGRLDPFIRLATHFIAGKPIPTFADGVRSQTIIEAVRTSDKEKRWIKTPA